jgi:hypothetical protein
MSDLNSPKSAFSKPENWVTWIVTAGVGITALYFLYNALPYINSIIEMGWIAVATGLPLAVLIFVLMNKGVHKVIWGAWTIGLKWLTGRVIELDPIAIMEGYAKHYDSIIQNIKDAMNGFRAQIKNLQANIANGNEQIKRSLNLASQAKANLASDPSLTKTMELQAFNASQYEESNKRFQEMLDFLNKHLDTCKEFLDTSTFNKMKLETTIKIKSSERDAMLALRKTMSAFKRLIDGDDELDMFNQAIEVENQFVAKTLGEFEQFTDDSQSVLQAGKLDKLANKSDAIARIEAWDKQKIDGLKMRVEPGLVPTSMPTTQNSSESFDDLLGSDDTQARLRN